MSAAYSSQSRSRSPRPCTPRVWSKSDERQPRNLLGVLGGVVAALGQLDHAAPPDVGIPVDLRDLLAVAVDVVEDEPLAQREIAERDVVRPEPPQDRVEQHRACHDDVGAPRLEARQRQPLLRARATRTCFRSRWIWRAGIRRFRTSPGA